LIADIKIRSYSIGNADRYLLLSIAACFVGGMLNFATKVSVINGVEPFKLLLWRFLTVVLICIFYIIKNKKISLDLKNIKNAFLSGLFLFFAVFYLLTAFKSGDVAVVLPITQLAFVLVAVISWIVFGEKVSIKKITGIILAVMTVILIN
jgi:uncharacterized membrane protein